VRHTFTHFELEIEVWAAEVAQQPKADGAWVSDLANAALPTVMRKIVAHAFNGQARSARKR
jgi:A/G-specific adenine glycosylase